MTELRIEPRDPLVLRQIAGALHTVRCWSDQPDQPEDLIDWLRERMRLMLVDRLPRAVFWEGAPVAEDAWDQAEKPWNLLWTLTCRGCWRCSDRRRPQPIRDATIFDE